MVKLYTLGQSVMNSWFIPALTLAEAEQLLEWTKDIKKNNRMQEQIFERDILMSKQYNEVIRTAVVQDQAVRTTLARQLEIFENEPHEGRIPQEEQDELDNQREEEKGKEEEFSSILFDEKNKDSLMESINEIRLISETRLPISSDNISEYKLSNESISNEFGFEANDINRTLQINKEIKKDGINFIENFIKEIKNNLLSLPSSSNNNISKSSSRRHKPDNKALSEIRKYQKTTKLLLHKLPFSRVASI
nr:13839_t:CDS:2 [Entrophospora candida]